MNLFLTIQALHEEGVAKKAIARRLGLDPRTVRKYVRRIKEGMREPNRAPVPRKLDRFDDLIQAKASQGLSAVQVYQDLCREPNFDASYESVKRWMQPLRPTKIQSYCRMVFAPGEEAQIDFGAVGRWEVEGMLRQVWLFAMTLCFSRFSYYELVLDQKVPTFLGAIRHGFEFFGGVPERIKPDNLKSAVLTNQLGERYYQKDFFHFCRHYGTVADAARPATPTDKGRVERDIGYVKGSCFGGRELATLEAAGAHLDKWANEVARVRVHGTTRRRPVDLFEEERPHLKPLPCDPYEIATWGYYKVRKDCHIHVAGNYYSVPHELVGQQVSVRLSEGELRVFSEDIEVARHPIALGKGRDITDPSHYPATKRLATQEIRHRRLQEVRAAGARSAEFVGRLKEGQWVFGDQLARMARLVSFYGEQRFERACARALFYKALSAQTLERILERELDQLPLPCEIVTPTSSRGLDFERPLAEYDALLDGWEVAR